jgi:2-methylcitrate dehydratase PrpD
LLCPEFTGAIRDVSYKPYSHSTDLHSAVDAVLDLCGESKIEPDDVAWVEVGLPKAAFDATAAHVEALRQPATVRAAQQSVYFAVAVAIQAFKPGCRAETFHDWFTEGRLTDPGILELAARVSAHVDDSLDRTPADSSSASVRIAARDGRWVARQVRDHRGSPARPFTWTDLKARVRTLTPEADRVIMAVEALPDAPSIADVGRVLRQTPLSTNAEA